MKATELMINDWVDSSFFGKTRVTSLKEHAGYGWVMTSGNKIWKSDASLSPILLTAEILEKNIPFERYWDVTKNNPKGSVTEWRKDTDEATIFVRDFRDQKGEYILEIHIKGSANYGVKKNIYYVHELQRALRCCGLNNLADDFKI